MRTVRRPSGLHLHRRRTNRVQELIKHPRDLLPVQDDHYDAVPRLHFIIDEEDDGDTSLLPQEDYCSSQLSGYSVLRPTRGTGTSGGSEH